MDNSKNCSFYYELCILQTLYQKGYLSKSAYEAIVRIAAEEYKASIYIGPKIYV